jgi:queuine tRNA-ribosyltransferase
VSHLEKVQYGYDQAFYCTRKLLQDLQQSAEYIANSNQVANAIGGLSVGEPAEEMYAMTEVVCEILPEDKPRYLMGVELNKYFGKHSLGS